MGYHHSGTLLQDRSCHRSPEILSKLDDQSGRSPAVVRGSLYGFVSGNGHNKDRARPMHETGGLAKQSHGICKYGASFITMKMYVKIYCQFVENLHFYNCTNESHLVCQF